jgi:hypothetical protein
MDADSIQGKVCNQDSSVKGLSAGTEDAVVPVTVVAPKTIDAGLVPASVLMNDKEQPKQQQQQKDKSITTTIQNLGRHARERLQSVKSKRRVIQRIDHELDVSSFKDDKEISLLSKTEIQASSNRIVTTISTRQKRAEQLTRTSHTKRKRSSKTKPSEELDTNPQKIDRWMPDVSHIQHPTVEGGNSNQDGTTMDLSDVIVLQLHGLPRHTTSQQIRAFFSGLQLHRIIVLLPPASPPLPTNAAAWNAEGKNEYNLFDYDADYTTQPQPPHNRDGNDSASKVHVERYDANMRVLIQFPTSTIATLAFQRSGETMYTNRLSNRRGIDRDAERDDDDVVGAAIAITMIPNTLAKTMIRLLGIEIPMTSTAKMTIEEILQPIIQQLDSSIPNILWSALTEEMSLRADTAAAPHLNLSRPHPCILGYFAKTEEEKSDVQHEKLEVQQEIDRILFVTTSQQHTNSNNNDWNMMLPFLFSGTTNSYLTEHNDRHQTYQNMIMNDLFQNSSSNDNRADCCCYNPTLYLTIQSVQILQTQVQRMDTILQYYERVCKISNAQHPNKCTF